MRDFNEEYERGYRAGRREALRSLDEGEKTLTRGQKAEINREKDKTQRRRDARKLIRAISSDLSKIEQLLRYYSHDSNTNFELWRHAELANKEINDLSARLDKLDNLAIWRDRFELN